MPLCTDIPAKVITLEKTFSTLPDRITYFFCIHNNLGELISKPHTHTRTRHAMVSDGWLQGRGGGVHAVNQPGTGQPLLLLKLITETPQIYKYSP